MSSPAAPRHTNRLIHSNSPYLLQHAHNPVDWYPWGPEAFDRARREDKPIFLSVGYSTCYWCHVMERQSFEDEQIAAVMNEHFVNVKVDREERPDVDQVYMTAVQIITRQGGWPMSVFLTPDLKPFFGGTYFPPADGHGRPGFPRVVQSLSQTYRTKRDQVDKQAAEIARLIARVAEPRTPAHPIRLDHAWVEALIERSTAEYESCYGGFSGAPKFPRQTLLELLLAYLRSGDTTEDAAQIQDQLLYTLDRMAEGGLRDQLGGGFHRYSTDERWLVPHFEIMLYDNAMLAPVYALAARLPGADRPQYEAVARGVCDFVLRDMTSPAGPFYTAFDAEVDAQEGLTYLWTRDEVADVLAAAGFGTLVDWFTRVYGLDDGPNFADPHHGPGVPDKSILHVSDPRGGADKLHPFLDPVLATMRDALLTHRATRKQPLLDTKILTSWNGLMIRALAVCGRVLAEPRYTTAAARAADWLLANHRMADGTLLRTSRPDAPVADRNSHIEHPPIPGFLDDYAFLAQALLALHESTGDDKWHAAARRVAEAMKDKFLDREAGGFYFTAADATDLIVRQKLAQDSPLPSGNAVAAMALLALGDDAEARDTLAVFAQSMEDGAEGMSSMVHAALVYLSKYEPFAVASSEDQPDRPLTPEQTARAAVDLAASWVGPTELRVTLRVLDPFHLNASRTAPGLIPTRLTVTAPTASVEAVVEYPPGEERRYAYVEAPLAVYAGEVTLVARFPHPLPTGTAVRATLNYQPCTDDACLPDTDQSIDLPAP